MKDVWEKIVKGKRMRRDEARKKNDDPVKNNKGWTLGNIEEKRKVKEKKLI